MSVAGWIYKTEPSTYSIEDLKREKRVRWDGVRNYLARNFLRQAALGAPVAIWHSSTKVPGVVGLAKVVKTGYPDPTAFDRAHAAYDPKSKPEAPTWYSVDVAYVSQLAQPLPAAQLRADPVLKDLLLFRQGRLSVSPVEAAAWKKLCQLALWGKIG
jgi:predicted RNA-binding protein with PUA-like domain